MTPKYGWLASRSRNIYSQFGEDGLVDAIFEKIGIENNWCFECGAADGLFFSNTRRFVKDGWNAVLVEADPAAHRSLTENSAAFPRAQIYCENLKEIDPILSKADAPFDLDIAIIDVDGQDYHLFNSMLRYRPRVVIVEFDPNADGWFIPDIDGPGQAGLKAVLRLFSGRFYTPVARTWNNLIAVAQPLDQLLAQKE